MHFRLLISRFRRRIPLKGSIIWSLRVRFFERRSLTKGPNNARDSIGHGSQVCVVSSMLNLESRRIPNVSSRFHFPFHLAIVLIVRRTRFSRAKSCFRARNEQLGTMNDRRISLDCLVPKIPKIQSNDRFRKRILY